MHRCLKCGKKFEHISEEMLNGCPECGGRFFLYIRDGTDLNAEELVERLKIEESDEGISPDERIESLRIIGTGIYELNLDALMSKEEIVMGLRHNGTYAIHLPSLFAKKKKKRKQKGKE